MTKARWFVVLIDYEGKCTAEPCDSYDEAYSRGRQALGDSEYEGFHIVLSAGYWK